MMLKKALFYSQGAKMKPWKVFPLIAGGKTPITKRGYLDATTDQYTIERWFTSNPRANIGIPTGMVNNIIVIDVDDDGITKYGKDSLEELENKLGALPETPTVNTPSGGMHLYFQYPPVAYSLRCSASLLAPNIDIRANGGYVVGAGSTRSDGKSWVWDAEYNPANYPFAELPNAWLMAIKSASGASEYHGARGKIKLSPLNKKPFVLPHTIESGTRNDTLYRYGASLRAFGIDSREVIEYALNTLNAERVHPILEQHEVDIIINQVMKLPSKNEHQAR